MSFTTAQIENIVIDAGAVYLNYGLGEAAGERILAPTMGGNSFSVEQEIKEIEVDGIKGKTKNLRRIITENASLSVNLADLSLENLKVALPGTTLASSTLTSTGNIADTDYISNVALVGETMKGEYKVIIIYNALADNGLSIEMTDKEETSVEVQFSAHYDPTDLTAPLYEVKDVVGPITIGA